MRLLFATSVLLTFLIALPNVFGLQITTEDVWMGIYSGDQKIGYSHSVIEPMANGTKIVEESTLRMTVLGADQDVRIKSAYFLNNYKIQGFEFSMSAGSVQLEAKGEREGKDLKIEINSVSGKTNISFPLKDEPLVSPLLHKWLIDQKPNVGSEYEVTLFDPASVLTGAKPETLKARLRVEGKEAVNIPLGSFQTYRVKMDFTGSEFTSWITEKGEVIKEISPPGLTAYKETEGMVLGESLYSFNIVEKTAISSNVPLENARGLKSLRVKLDGIGSTDGLDLDDDNRQFYKDGILEIRVGELSQIKSYAIPYSEGEFEPYLKPTSLIQSGNPKIANRAKDILSGEKDSVRVVQKINDWVYKNLEKVATLSIPNALDVLETRKGDCNEHATLFAALSRAAGIPTRIALGVVFLDGKFYYHAWDEVFVGGWIAVDPTFGQVPADASHIKLIEGDLSKSSEIMRLVGNIKLEIEDAS